MEAVAYALPTRTGFGCAHHLEFMHWNFEPGLHVAGSEKKFIAGRTSAAVCAAPRQGQLHGFTCDAYRIPNPYVRLRQNADGTYEIVKLGDWKHTAIYSTVEVPKVTQEIRLQDGTPVKIYEWISWPEYALPEVDK